MKLTQIWKYQTWCVFWIWIFHNSVHSCVCGSHEGGKKNQIQATWACCVNVSQSGVDNGWMVSWWCPKVFHEFSIKLLWFPPVWMETLPQLSQSHLALSQDVNALSQAEQAVAANHSEPQEQWCKNHINFSALFSSTLPHQLSCPAPQLVEPNKYSSGSSPLLTSDTSLISCSAAAH